MIYEKLILISHEMIKFLLKIIEFIIFAYQLLSPNKIGKYLITLALFFLEK